MSTENREEPGMTTEQQIKTLKLSERVLDLSQKVFGMIVSETEDLGGNERWMVISRVVTTVFAHHFNLALQTVGQRMAERDPGVPPPPSQL